MLWLCKRIALIVVMLTVAVSLAVTFGRQQSPPQQISRLYMNAVCQLPCWIGITPGVTSLQEANQKVVNFFGALPDYQIQNDQDQYDYQVFDRISKKQAFTIYFSFDPLLSSAANQTIVGAIFLDFRLKDARTSLWNVSSASPSLADFIAFLGQPDTGIQCKDGNCIPSILYEDHRTVIYADTQGYATSRSISLGVSTPVDLLCWADEYWWENNHVGKIQAWTGFHHYRNLDAP